MLPSSRGSGSSEKMPLRYSGTEPSSSSSSRAGSPTRVPGKSRYTPMTASAAPASTYPLSSPTPIFNTGRRYMWVFEFLCLATSFLAILGSIYLLWRYDGEPIPKWAWQQGGISLNSILSLLSALSRSSLLVPLDEALGQLMWLAFMERERRLVEVEIYNEAARGPLGALRLLWAKGGRGIETVGALIMLMAMILGTAQQQLLSYPTQTRIIDSPSVLVGSAPAIYDSYQLTTPFNDPNGATIPTVDFPVAASMFASLNSESPVIPLHRCGTGSCAFPTFSSLGVCAECRDETASLASSCEDGADTCTASYNSVTATNYKEPSGGYSSIVNQSSITNSSGIADIYTLTASTSFPPAYSATYCSLMWCVKTINATVTNSTYRETLLSTSTAAEPQPDGTAIFRYVSPIDNQPGNFSVSPQAQQAFKTLAGDLKGWSKRQSEREFIHSSPIFAGISEFTISPPNTSYTASDRTTPNSPIPLIAAALTTSLRSSLSITGQFVERRTIIRVRWYWLLFPSVMWIFSAVFLIVTVWKSWRNENRVGSWGTSGLALMLFGVRDETVRRNVASWSGKEMEKRAKKVWVRLNRDERDGWGLVRAEKT